MALHFVFILANIHVFISCVCSSYGWDGNFILSLCMHWWIHYLSAEPSHACSQVRTCFFFQKNQKKICSPVQTSQIQMWDCGILTKTLFDTKWVFLFLFLSPSILWQLWNYRHKYFFKCYHKCEKGSRFCLGKARFVKRRNATTAVCAWTPMGG